MAGPSLQKLGDFEEQKRWKDVKPHFQLYEEFWQRHVFTLRDEKGQIRSDIDERLELMAQEHYKCFISFSKALTGLADDARPEQVFSSLQNAGNRAQCVINLFNSIRVACIGKADKVDQTAFRGYCSGIALYRNLIHEDVSPSVLYKGKRFIPRPEKLHKYLRWSSLRTPDRGDLLPLVDLVRVEFKTLSDLLNSHWKEMLARSEAVLKSTEYRKLHPPFGKSITYVGPITLSSNTQLG